MSSPNNLELLKKLVSIPSVYPNESEIGISLAELLKSKGLKLEKVKTAEGRINLIATAGSAKKYLCLYGHMDTVPPASDYQRNPFEVAVEGDIARGLGVCDMKGGLVCILQAVFWAAENNLPVKAIFGVDEEDISLGANDLVNSGLLKDAGFLIAAESGQVSDHNQAFSVNLGRKGRIAFEIEIRGKTAHAAEKQNGINAIEQASVLINKLKNLTLPAHNNLGESFFVIQKINSAAEGLSVPDKCSIELSLFTVPGFSSSDFSNLVIKEAKDCGVNINIKPVERGSPYSEAFEIDVNNNFYQRLHKEIITPAGVTPVYSHSVADENVFAKGLNIPVFSIGVIGGGDHTKDEWSKLSTFDNVINAFKTAISLWSESGLSST